LLRGATERLFQARHERRPEAGGYWRRTLASRVVLDPGGAISKTPR
jgi:hypothetical protein